MEQKGHFPALTALKGLFILIIVLHNTLPIIPLFSNVPGTAVIMMVMMLMVMIVVMMMLMIVVMMVVMFVVVMVMHRKHPPFSVL